MAKKSVLIKTHCKAQEAQKSLEETNELNEIKGNIPYMQKT